MTLSVGAKDEPKLLPGDLAIWFFIFMELLVFSIGFISYVVMYYQNVDLFNEYQKALNKEFGLINTLLLITSSYFVISSIHAIRKNKSDECARYLFIALACGLGFLIIKSIEYYDKISIGISLDTNLFYFFYFALTFFHFLHVIMGMIILLFVAIKAKLGKYSANDHMGLETAASYWHMVDLVWIVLFPLVYIIK